MFRYPLAWTRFTWLTLLLLPLSWLFGAAAALRRALYRAGVLRREHVPVPVIVVGNVSAGGTGKTPLVIWLAAHLRAAGYRPGIISRGYGGSASGPCAVKAHDDPAHCGDEPLLLARHTLCPVWIGKQRAAVAQALLAAHPECDVIISDDGLQHYALARDVEIAVIDGARGLGNGRLLPAGPLREPAARLDAVDAVVVRAPVSADVAQKHFVMRFTPAGFVNLRDANRRVYASHFEGLRVHALAGIGNPQQFFDTLARLNIAHTPHAFPDHHAFSAADLAFEHCDAIVMTQKDAVKCERHAADQHWALQIEAELDPALALLVLARISRKD
ncbi:MAG: tetraacyldisaccharide 4'-kinase [Betaproteobacteria bacterium]|nr:tetraacyldisaccharide 4'-kinase [Betaproteobacteria bacterium]